MRRPYVARVVLAAGVLAASGSAAVATSDAGDEGPPPSQAVQQVDPEQAQHYAVLRRERTVADQLSSAHQAFVDDAVTRDNGAASRLSRLAARTPSGDGVYVLPGRGWICTFVTRSEGGGGGVCNRTGEALKGYIAVTTSLAPGVMRVVGLVPDGVSEVVLRADDGTVERAAVHSNAYVFETPRRPKQVEWGDAVIPVSMAPEG